MGGAVPWRQRFALPIRSELKRSHEYRVCRPRRAFVDWIQAAGHPVERVSDHRHWIERFETKLDALPEHQRQPSSLSVLDSLRHPYDASKPQLGSRRFQAAVRALPLGNAPHLTREYIHKCLDDLRRLGLIPALGVHAVTETAAA